VNLFSSIGIARVQHSMDTYAAESYKNSFRCGDAIGYLLDGSVSTCSMLAYTTKTLFLFGLEASPFFSTREISVYGILVGLAML